MSTLAAEEEEIKLAGIYYFGYQGMDLTKIKSSMPIKSGDCFAGYPELQAKIKKSIKELIGKESTDEALVFFDKKYVAFVGLPGTSNKTVPLLPVPTGQGRVPAVIHDLYQKTMLANVEQLKTGAESERKAYFDLRDKTAKEAAKVSPLLQEVLLNSSDANERYVAAHALGLIASSQEQLSALVRASSDPNPNVRNDAARAIGVILMDSPEKASQVPFGSFVGMLESPTWTDKNKGLFVLDGLTKSRNIDVLQALRARAIPALKEMCNWPRDYADGALVVLGRMAELPEQQIEQLIKDGQDDVILSALEKLVQNQNAQASVGSKSAK